MTAQTARRSARRRPRQRRSVETVDAILDAVVRLLKREGYTALTTNHIAETAGVSIGSVYQYFSDKSAIFQALHQRHIDQIDHLIATTLVNHAASPLDVLISALVEGMVDAHAPDPQLFELLSTEVPHRCDPTQEFAARLHGVFRLALSARLPDSRRRRDLDKIAFVVAKYGRVAFACGSTAQAFRTIGGGGKGRGGEGGVGLFAYRIGRAACLKNPGGWWRLQCHLRTRFSGAPSRAMPRAVMR